MLEESIPPACFELAPGVAIGGHPFLLIAGPCAVESEALVMDTARRLKEITASLKIPFVFKASFDKANRSSLKSFRSIGWDDALQILDGVRREIGVPVLTDVHETAQVERTAQCVDILQIPAFLCRQTDLLLECGHSGLPVNIKKGQFMAPEDMRGAVEKIRETGNARVLLTERGTSFGYHNLVVDYRSLPIMRRFAPVVFDATHSVQTPGGLGDSSGGQREFVPTLARAAAAAGVDGFFIETHPDPSRALSDGPNMIPLDEMPLLLQSLLDVSTASRYSQG
ncbi:MAG: 3-deoxy-8-phosphooctulonate synthase [Candidatus Omnitrophota bacterium]